MQDILSSHRNGERTREHPHFLKGSLYCRKCGSRMIVTHSKNSAGVVYPYYICAGRHSKRERQCRLKAVLIETVERKVEELYDSISLPLELREKVERSIAAVMEKQSEQRKVGLEAMKRERDKLERQRDKLLDLYYADAMPIDKFKDEQQKITSQIAAIDYEITAQNVSFEHIRNNLKVAASLIENCKTAYQTADDRAKKMMNQIVFEKIWIGEEEDVGAELAEPFKTISHIAGRNNHLLNAEIRKKKLLADSLLDHSVSVSQTNTPATLDYCLNNGFLVGAT